MHVCHLVCTEPLAFRVEKEILPLMHVCHLVCTEPLAFRVETRDK